MLLWLTRRSCFRVSGETNRFSCITSHYYYPRSSSDDDDEQDNEFKLYWVLPKLSVETTSCNLQLIGKWTFWSPDRSKISWIMISLFCGSCGVLVFSGKLIVIFLRHSLFPIPLLRLLFADSSWMLLFHCSCVESSCLHYSHLESSFLLPTSVFYYITLWFWFLWLCLWDFIFARVCILFGWQQLWWLQAAANVSTVN
jgi:hypothetical protein